MSDSDIEYYDSDDDNWSDEQEEPDDDQVEIENTFYEAEDQKKSNPAAALQGFLRVLELEKDVDPVESQWRFKSLKHIVMIQANLQDYEGMLNHHLQLLDQMPYATRNDATDAINGIIEAVSKLPDPNSSMQVFSVTVEKLKASKNEKLWFNTLAKLAKMYLESGDIEKAESGIQELIQSCKLPNGQDDPNKSQPLLEAYSLLIQLCVAVKDNKKMKEVYKQAEKLTADYQDSRIMGIIRESGSKMYMSEKNWEKALTEFFETFRCYQELGNPRAKVILKYVVLASILASSEINPFDSQEAKVYKDDPEILAMMRLRQAYESNNITELQSILQDRSANILSDSYIQEYLEDLLRSVRMTILVAKIKPYKAVRIPFLAQELTISTENVISLLVELLLEGKIQGQIDEIESVLIVNQEEGGGSTRRDKAIDNWAKSLRSINSSLMERIRIN